MLKNHLKDPSLLVERAYVDGQWIVADDGATLDITDPATGDVIAQVPALQGAETRRAIEAADRAWPAWRARPAAERAALLERWHQAMLENVEDLALIMTLEQGKPLNESRGERSATAPASSNGSPKKRVARMVKPFLRRALIAV